MTETICEQTQKFIEENLSINPNHELIDRGGYKVLRYKPKFEDMPTKQSITEITFTLNRDVVGHPVTIEMFREGDTIPKGSIIIDVTGSEIICLVPYSIVHNPHKGQAFDEFEKEEAENRLDMCESQEVQLDCRIGHCSFNNGSGHCTHKSPQLSINKPSDVSRMLPTNCWTYKSK